MSFRKGERRRGKVAAALTTVGALAAFQALAIVGAQFASAATCAYDPSTDAVNLTIGSGEFVNLAVEGPNATALDLDPAAAPGSILANLNGAGFLACGSASNTNTVSITVLGSVGTNELFILNNNVGGTGDSGEFNTAIAWSIDLGTGTDTFTINAGDGNDNIVGTDSSFDLNGGVGELLGAELFFVAGRDGNDVIDLSATTIPNILSGAGGVDVLSPGTATGDTANGGGDCGDTLSYGTRTTATVVDASLGVAGFDANGNGVLDGAEEVDSFGGFDTYVTGTGNDTLTGDAGTNDWFVPGDGDDDISGNGADHDTLDYTTSTAPMVIDFPNGTATGQGVDTFDGVDQFVGSPLDDTMVVDDDAPGGGLFTFSGGAGVDTVDASGARAGVEIDLDSLEDLLVCGSFEDPDDLENAIGSAFNDDLIGNEVRNQLNGGDGDDFLDGAEGNDVLLGEGGNDTFQGGTGADRVSFINSPQRVNVDLSLGFATGEGDDAFNDGIEIIIGSAFNDSVTGGPFGGGGTVNFLFVGKAGKDTLTGFSGNDTLKGGGGADTLRGVGGDDTLKGAAGNDRLFGGGGTDVGKGGDGKDTCDKVEIKTSCGTKNNPAAPQNGIAGRLN
jgi:Ca2+-binding RTX toxin-like protein